MELELKDFVKYYTFTGHMSAGEKRGLQRTLSDYAARLANERACLNTPELYAEAYQMYLQGRKAFRQGRSVATTISPAKQYAAEIHAHCIERGLKPSTVASYLIGLAKNGKV